MHLVQQMPKFTCGAASMAGLLLCALPGAASSSCRERACSGAASRVADVACSSPVDTPPGTAAAFAEASAGEASVRKPASFLPQALYPAHHNAGVAVQGCEPGVLPAPRHAAEGGDQVIQELATPGMAAREPAACSNMAVFSFRENSAASRSDGLACKHDTARLSRCIEPVAGSRKEPAAGMEDLFRHNLFEVSASSAHARA